MSEPARMPGKLSGSVTCQKTCRGPAPSGPLGCLAGGEGLDGGPESLATLLEVRELVEGGAGRRQQDHLARPRPGRGGLHRLFQGAAARHGRGPAQFPLDFRGGPPA